MKRLIEAIAVAIEAHADNIRTTLERQAHDEWMRGYADGLETGQAARQTAMAQAWDRCRREAYRHESQGLRDVYNPYRQSASDTAA
jgi:flagellar biosynthesis/type III secretory pathway protein FliH